MITQEKIKSCSQECIVLFASRTIQNVRRFFQVSSVAAKVYISSIFLISQRLHGFDFRRMDLESIMDLLVMYVLE